ncbi:hypothetical protein HNP12_004748 [Aeromonas hydrophila]|nr:hypothetical protein [Aeromonas hydrophila]
MTGVAPGEMTVTASGKANGQSFSASVKVSISSAVVMALQVTPARVSLPVGLKQQLKAEVTLSDGSVFDVTDNDALSWSGNNAQIATVGNSGQDKGRVTGVAPGEMTVTASGKANGQSFSASVEVSIGSAVVTTLQIIPTDISLPVGLKQQLKAEVTLSDGSVFDVTDSDALSWSGSDVQIATVGNSGQDKGRVTGVAPGEITVTASGKANGQSFSANAKVDVNDILEPDFGAGCRFGIINIDNAVYTCPILKGQADIYGFPYSGTAVENGNTYVVMNWEEASTYCNALGDSFRLPNKDELVALYEKYGSMSTYAGWPVNYPYWSSNSFDSMMHSVVQLISGDSFGDIDTNNVFVSCIKR